MISTTSSIPLSALDTQRDRAKAAFHAVLGKAAILEDRYRGFLALCDQGVVSAANFATGVIIGRVCGRPELGVYTLAWTLLTLATDISALLTTVPYTVFSHRLSRGRRRRYLGSIFMHQLLLSLMFASTMAIGAALGSWMGWLSNSLSSVVTITAGVTVFITLREFVRRVSFAELRTGSALSIDVIACIAQAGGMLLLFRFGALTASRTVTVLGISSGVIAGGWLALNRRAIRPGTRSCWRDLTFNWRFSKWVLGSGILSVFARYLYPWVLAAFHGTSVTGKWAACSAIVALGNPIFLGLGNYVLPKVSNVYATSGTTAMKRYVHRSSLLFGVLLAPIVLILAAWGERIVTGVYGRAYSDSATVVLLLALNMLVTALMYPYSQGLFSLESARADTLVNVITVALLFTLGLFAVRSYGALGAATALLVSNSLAGIVRIGVFANEVNRRSSRALPPRTLSLSVAAPPVSMNWNDTQ